MIDYNNIPLEMKGLKQWVGSRQTIRVNGKPTKVPINCVTKQFAKTNDTSTWHDFQTVIDNLQDPDGIGFVLQSSNRILFIDLDDCMVESKPNPFAFDILKNIKSYFQLSVSGTGIHIFCKIREGIDLEQFSCKTDTLEIYSNLRFAQMTGNVKKVLPLNTLTEEQEQFLLSKVNEIKALAAAKKQKQREANPVESNSEFPFTKYNVLLIRDALKQITTVSEDEWFNKVTRAIASAAEEHPEFEKPLKRLWDDWSQAQDGYDEAENMDRWERAKVSTSQVSLGTLYHLAKEGNPLWEPQPAYNFEQEINGQAVVTTYTSPNKKYQDAIAKYGAGALEAEPLEPIVKKWIDDKLVLDAIDGTLFGEIVSILSDYGRPKIPIQIPLTQAIFILGAAMSSKRNDGLVSDFGAELAKVRIYGTTDASTCATYCLLVSPKGSGKDLSKISTLFRRVGMKCINSVTSQGLVDECESTPNLGLYLGEFQKILSDSDSNQSLKSSLKTIFSDYSYEEKLSKRQNKIHKVADRNVDYLSPSILGSIQPKSLSRNMLRESIDDGLMDRFLISYYVDTQYLIQPHQISSEQLNRIIAIIEHFQELSGDFLHRTYATELDALFDALTKGKNKECSFEARIASIYGPKFAIMLAGSLKIEPSIWKRVEYISKLFVQNYHEVLGETYEDSWDAKNAAKDKKLEEFIRRKCLEGQPPNKRDIAQMPGGLHKKMDRENALEYLLEAGIISYDVATKRFHYNERRIILQPEQVTFDPVTKPALLQKTTCTLEKIMYSNTLSETMTSAVINDMPVETDIFEPDLNKEDGANGM